MQPELHPLDEEEFCKAVELLLDEAEDFMDARVRPVANSSWAAYWDQVNVEPEVGGSDVVVPVVRDVAHSLMPDLMEVLAGNESVVEYVGRSLPQQQQRPGEPPRPPPQVMAEKATLLAQDVFWQDCRGWQQLHDACLEGLVGNVGCLKAFNREKMCLYEHELVEPDPLLMVALTGTPGVTLGDPQEGEDGQLTYPVKKYQVERELVIESVPACDLVFTDAVDADSCRLIGERMELRRGDLIAMRIDQEDVEGLKSDSRTGYSEARQARQNREDDRQRKQQGVTWALEPVTVYKLYVQIDADGDGLTERWEVLLGSGSGARNKRSTKILKRQKVDGQPYCPFAANRLSNQIHGRTLEQVLGDLQDQRTALRRDTLDNARLINSPLMLGTSGIDAQALRDWRKLKFVKETIAGSVRWFQPPPTVQYLLQVDQALELQQESGTGISRVAMGLDPDALTNVTATAIQGTLGAAQRKMEMMARSVAECGLKPLYQKLLRLMVGMPPRMVIGNSGGMEIVSPDALDPTFSVRVKVGIGPAARMAKSAALDKVLALQIQAIGAGRMELTDTSYVGNTMQDMLSTVGLRYDRYFKPEAEVKAALQQEAQAGPPPDPKMIEAQGKLQIGQQKLQSDMQATQQKMQADAQMSAQKLQMDFAAKMQELQAKQQAEMQKMEQEFALRIREQNIEAVLGREQIAVKGANDAAAANIKRAN